MPNQTITKLTSITIVIAALFLVNSLILAWTTPTLPPPDGNTPTPINIGPTEQYKEGALGIGGVFRTYSNAVIDGALSVVGNITTLAPTLNNHVATKEYVDAAGGGVTIPPGPAGCDLFEDCDGDGYVAYTGDCNENCATCYVGSASYTIGPDGLDQNCNGQIDEAVDSVWTAFRCGVPDGIWTPVRHQSCNQDSDDLICQNICISENYNSGKSSACERSSVEGDIWYWVCDGNRFYKDASYIDGSEYHMIQCKCETVSYR